MAKSKNKIVAEICLYGNGSPEGNGVGWLACKLPMGFGSMLGTGEPNKKHSPSMAISEAAEALRNAGAVGKAWVYSSGGQWKAPINLAMPGLYGDLAWEPAEQYVISMEDILKHAEPAGMGV